MRQKMQKKRVQKPKLGPAKRARKRVRGAFQGRRTSRFAGIYIYIYIYICLPTKNRGSVRNSMKLNSKVPHFWGDIRKVPTRVSAYVSIYIYIYIYIFILGENVGILVKKTKAKKNTYIFLRQKKRHEILTT